MNWGSMENIDQTFLGRHLQWASQPNTLTSLVTDKSNLKNFTIHRNSHPKYIPIWCIKVFPLVKGYYYQSKEKAKAKPTKLKTAIDNLKGKLLQDRMFMCCILSIKWQLLGEEKIWRGWLGLGVLESKNQAAETSWEWDRSSEASEFSNWRSTRTGAFCIPWGATVGARLLYLIRMWILADQLNVSQAQGLEILTQVKPANSTIANFKQKHVQKSW